MATCRRTRITVVPSLLLCVAPLLYAQTSARITGTIAHAITGSPLSGIVVTVVGSTMQAITDDDGIYAIDSVLPGLVKLTAQGLGYHPITTDYYTALPAKLLDVDFKLAPVVVSLEGVEVTGERPVREYPGAMVLTSKDLPPRGDILNALQGAVPSISVRGRRDDTRVRARGSLSEVLFVIDGVVTTPPLRFYIDAANVDCVEVRRGHLAAQEYRSSINSEIYSGVVLIWTKGAFGAKPRSCFKS